MKKTLIYLLVTTCFIFMLSSCLKTDLPDIVNSSDNLVTGFNFEYRWVTYTKVKDKQTGAVVDSIPYVNISSIQETSVIVRQPNAIDQITCTLVKPTNVPVSEKVSLKKLWGYASIPDAATIAPLNNGPELGKPGDYSAPVTYRVTAADGSSKDVTITVSGF